MRAHILYIGILDELGCQHSVDFATGVNVITGRSSTGKSALIEIFDYCFGSSDFTVPAGVITKNAQLFFCVLKLRQSILVLGRHPNSKKAFIREDFDVDRFSSIDWLDDSYFGKEDFYLLRDFLRTLKRFFGIIITDIDEDMSARDARGMKMATPSVRSFTSFMLQHQNLIANKHAVFYRFDQKEKREQAIEHLKIFLGFVDQNYFLLRQRYTQLEADRRQLLRELPRRADKLNESRKRLEDALFELEAISGETFAIDLEAAIRSPQATLRQIGLQKITFSSDSNEHVKKQFEEEEKKSKIVGRLRELQVQLAEVDSSIAFSGRYSEEQRETVIPKHIHLTKEECPFCNAPSISVEKEANKLSSAIEWLNNELRRSSYRRESYEEERKGILGQIEGVRSELRESEARLDVLRKQIAQLKQTSNQYELTIRARTRLENVLEDCLKIKLGGSEQDLERVQTELKKISSELAEKYDVERKMGQAEKRIEQLMHEYGQRFDFERSYQPINLRFSLSTFDLWHQVDANEKVFLRAMGSGANWLSSHLVLFLSLQRYFCELRDSCLIPPILFIDQPSQVYFPAILDGDTDFDANALAQRDQSRGDREVDEDLKAVTNLFDQLVRHCEETKADTGICPQIIVSDHADHLKLSEGIPFEQLVRRRWRQDGDGFIDLRGLLPD